MGFALVAIVVNIIPESIAKLAIVVAIQLINESDLLLP